MKLYLLPGIVFCVLLFQLPALAQGLIKGQVTTADGQSVDYINVVIKETDQQARTNEKGAYQMNRVKPGTYTLRIQSMGLSAQEKKITLHDQQVLVVDFVLQENNQKLQEVIVSGKKNKYKSGQPSSSLRLNEPLLEVPQNIQIVNAQTLADQQVISMADGLIKNVSGLTRLSHWADMYTRVNARGARMAAFRNGVNVTSTWGPLSEDMSFVDHVEFVKGPAGFLMSNGEPSGIYNVVTKKPTGSSPMKGEATFTLGSYDLYRSTIDLDGRADKSGKLLYRLNVMGQNKKSFRNYEYNNRYSVAPVISYQIDDQTTLTAEYTYQNAKMSDLGSVYAFSPVGYATLGRDFTTTDPGLEPTKIDDHSLFLNLQHHLDANWKVTAQLAYFNYAQQGANIWPSVVNANGTMVRNVSIWDAKNENRFGQFFVNGEMTTGKVKHRILAGLDLGDKDYMADWGQYHDLDLAENPFDPQQTTYQAPENGYPVWDRSTPLSQRAGVGGSISQAYTGLYLQDELGFWDNTLRLTLAGRFTYVKQSNYGVADEETRRFTPRVGLSVSIDDNTSAYALYDQSFVPQAGFLRNGGTIKPITGNNMELGLKKEWFEHKWSTTLSVYRILKNNELTADPTNNGSESFSVILGQSEAKGLEFDLQGELFKGMNVIANYAYTDSKVKSTTAGVVGITAGDRIPGFAKHNINTWLNYSITSGVLKGAGLSAGFSYQVDRDSWTWGGQNGIQDLPDYFRLDGGAFWEMGKVKINANVYNILDKYLYTGSYEGWAAPAYYAWQVEAPRNYRLSLAYKF
ncbi:iron complex outermembrane receptor protein [Pedobacter sp. CAN_A7]|uniref:TonB-dependent siderophore receptor n=1 Tax=Pedobacter sp. CAN_A7 TaxID=2787722 RepID=UPI0018CA20EA